MSEPTQQGPAQSRFAHLPEPVDLDRTISTHDPEPVPDPESGRDTDRDFLLLYTP